MAPQVPSAAATAQDRAQAVTGVMASSPPAYPCLREPCHSLDRKRNLPGTNQARPSKTLAR